MPAKVSVLGSFKMNYLRRTGKLSAIVSVMVILSAGLIGQDKKLSAEEIIQKHLASVGTAERRDEVKNHFAVGTSAFASKFPAKQTAGKALIVSQGGDLLFLASFASQEYPFEKIGFFRKDISLPHVTAGTRSPLGAFLADHPTMLRHGIFGGSLSRSWPFYSGNKLEGRIESSGTKKIDGKKVYGVDYFPSTNSSEFSVKLYFDAETFGHVRSEYRHVIAPQQDPFGTLGRQTGLKQTVIETFSDFKTVEGMTLPHTYKISYLTDSNSGVYEYDWGINISTFYFNQKLEPDFFTFEAKSAAK